MKNHSIAFDNYWSSHGFATNPAALGLSYREAAEKAWNAAIEAADDVCRTHRDMLEECIDILDKSFVAEEIGRDIRNLSISRGNVPSI